MRDFKGQSRLQTVYFNGGSLSWWKSQILSLSLFQPSSYALINTNLWVIQAQSNFLNIDPKGPSQVSALQMCQAYYRGTECVELGIFGAKRIFYNRQGHPMDLFHKISVLLAIFCWLGDVEVMICPWKESVVGNVMSEIAAMCCQKPLPHSPLPPPPSPPTEHPISSFHPPSPPPWRAEFCRLTTPKLAINVWTYICWETSE